jgi:hypothetical protein
MVRATMRLLVCLTAAGCLSLVGCDAGSFITEPIPAGDARVSLSPSELTMAVGESATITATVVRENGSTVNPKSLKWESTDPSRATVHGEGLVKGVAPGYSSIIASSGKAADTTLIRIVEGVARAGVNISPDTVVLKWLDATATLTAEVRDGEGTLVAEPGSIWTSLNPGIAQMDDRGIVTAKGVGVALIVATAACCDRADTAYARVYQEVDSVVIEEEKISLSPGNSVQLKPKALDRGGSVVEGATFEFRSADESIVKVSEDGILTSQSSGTTTVKANSEGQSDVVTVDVASTVAGTGSGRYPNEPAGHTPWFSHDWQTFPANPSEAMAASDAGFFYGSGVNNSYHRGTLVDDPTAPHGKGKSIRILVNEGIKAGNSTFNFSANSSPARLHDDFAHHHTQLRAVYVSMWLYFEPNAEHGDWQNYARWLRLFRLNNHVTGVCEGAGEIGTSLAWPWDSDGNDPNPKNDWDGVRIWGWEECEGGSSNFAHNYALRLPKVGEWVHIEWVFERLTGSMTDDDYMGESRIRSWINGQVWADVTQHHRWRRPIRQVAVNILGSSGGDDKARDDHMRIGDFYVSGIRIDQ